MTLLSLKSVSKAYPGVVAAHEVDLSVAAGEALGLVGKNGAGKSTIIRIVAGVEQPDSGEIFMDRRKVLFDRASDAIRAGIAVVHQELGDVPSLTVGENILLGLGYPKSLGLINKGRLRTRAQAALNAIHMDIDVDLPVSCLSVAERRMVMIARGMASNARIVVLDEPTASLTESEITDLFAAIRHLQKTGVGIIYVSHRLEEILKLTNRVSVMRDGRLVDNLPTAVLNEGKLVSLISGKPANCTPSKATNSRNEAQDMAIEVSGLVPLPGRPAMSLAVRKGQVIGLAGLAGSGRSEILRQIMGADANKALTIKVCGKPVQIKSPRDAWANGIALVPEDRRTQSAFLDFTLARNVTLASLKKHRVTDNLSWPSITRENSVTQRLMAKLKIKAQSVDTRIGTLSGGNQQKTILARCLAADADVLLLDEPTHGVDVDAKEETYRLIRQLADSGKAIILVSSELKELVGLVEKAFVVRDGHHVATLEGPEITEETILRHCFSSGMA